MRKTQSRRVNVPIKYKQPTLLKYDPSLPEPTPKSLVRQIEQLDEEKVDSRYKYHVTPENIVEIENMHCLDCGRRLVYNGFNNRLIILDRNLGIHRLRIHRKRCRYCGEIKPDYSALAPKYGNYHENYKRMSRQMYMNTIIPAKVRSVFQICFDITIAHSTIVRWVNEVAEPLREHLQSTPVPRSGYFGYDEIHMLVAGNKKYQINIIDLETKFIVNALIVNAANQDSAKRALQDCKYNQRGLIIKGIVKDGSTIFGNLFMKHGWKHIDLQLGIMHLKWNIAGYVKAYLGIFRQSRKSVPKDWAWLLKEFYNIIDSANETEFHIRIVRVAGIVKTLPGEKVKYLIQAIRKLHIKKDKILTHTRNHRLDSTNSLVESQNRRFERYTPFKRNMMKMSGAQRISDYIRFKRNLNLFTPIFEHLSLQFEEIRSLLLKFSGTPREYGRVYSLRSTYNKYIRWYEKYREIWTQWFRKF
ncbi:MAG: hypothetical protein GF364_02115 [Candidatus Lokiarchaeota archaeon]|nr:hypothetical protein [Candidatus Lokiarchaeota archaeon]